MESMTYSTADRELNHSSHNCSGSALRTAEAGLDLQYGTIPPQAAAEGSEETKANWIRCCRNTMSFFVNHLMTFMGLALGTYIGVSIRIGLPKFYKLDNFASFLPQIVGTSIMGVFMAHKESAVQAGVCSKFIYTIITTGVCGSLTTFSSWNVEASTALLQLNETDLQPMYRSINTDSIMDFVIVVLLGLGMPIAVFYFSKNISKWLVPTTISSCTCFLFKCFFAIQNKVTWLFPVINMLTYIIATSALVVTVYLYTNDYDVLFALLLGAPATYIRWCLGGLDEKCVGKFPIGTFIANILGSLVLSITIVVINYTTTIVTIGSIPVAILSGIAVGFCGSLTTVSTFVSQLCSDMLSLQISLLYVCLSLFLSQFIVNFVFISYSLLSN